MHIIVCVQAFMQCSAELVYQEVILQPEKMVQWNRTVSACQVTTLTYFYSSFSTCFIVLWQSLTELSDLLLRSFRGLTTTRWCHMMSPQEQQGGLCLRGTSAHSRNLFFSLISSSYFLSFLSYSHSDWRSEIKWIDWLIDFSSFRDFVNVRRVERKRDCYLSAGMATDHDAKPPSGRYVRSACEHHIDLTKVQLF